MSIQRPAKPYFPLDRTPIFLGVVILPLAASCLLHSGGLNVLRLQFGNESAPIHRLQIFFANERDRRAEAIFLGEETPDTPEQAATEQTHSGAPIPTAIAASAQHRTSRPALPIDFSQPHTHASIQAPRGPPTDNSIL